MTINQPLNSWDWSLGCNLPPQVWADFNRSLAFGDPTFQDRIAAFPPAQLMENTTGLTRNSDFAAHGADFWMALSRVSPKPLASYESILDFGCGCGRLARMFKGYRGQLIGCDIDYRHIQWCQTALPFMDAVLTKVNPPLPFADNSFACVISISIFTHLNEETQDNFLSDLFRIAAPRSTLMLTVHGKHAITRALNEVKIATMLSIPSTELVRSKQLFDTSDLSFVRQAGHLTNTHGVSNSSIVTEPFEYGITFTPPDYVRNHWTKWFEVISIEEGALHGFQDVVVLTPRKTHRAAN